MLNKYFAPYAEYTLRTKLSGEELCAALERECGFSFAHWEKSFLAAWHEQENYNANSAFCKLFLVVNFSAKNAAK